jgi:hypothetical protein
MYVCRRGTSPGYEAARHRTSHGVPRMLLWKHRKRKTSGSRGLAQKGMAFQGLAEARSIDD